MQSIILYRIDPSRNMRRFYRLDLDRDMFGFWVLIRQWGRIGRRGQHQATSFVSKDEAVSALQNQTRAKQLRGYKVQGCD